MRIFVDVSFPARAEDLQALSQAVPDFSIGEGRWYFQVVPDTGITFFTCRRVAGGIAWIKWSPWVDEHDEEPIYPRQSGEVHAQVITAWNAVGIEAIEALVATAEQLGVIDEILDPEHDSDVSMDFHLWPDGTTTDHRLFLSPSQRTSRLLPYTTTVVELVAAYTR